MRNEDFKRWSTDGRKLGTMELLFAEEAWKAATEACAAMKDAEIAEITKRKDTYFLEMCEVIEKNEKLLAEKADLQRSVKELREAMLPFAALLQEHNEHGDDSKPIFGINSALITLGDIRKAKALANSEHHNSRALEKMLLEARINEMVYVAPENRNSARLHELKVKLAELDKE